MADDLQPLQRRTSRRSGALTYPEPLGPPRPVAEHLCFTLLYNGNRSKLRKYYSFYRWRPAVSSLKLLLASILRSRAFDSHNLPFIVTNLKSINDLCAYFYTWNHERQKEYSAKVNLSLRRSKHCTMKTYKHMGREGTLSSHRNYRE